MNPIPRLRSTLLAVLLAGGAASLCSPGLAQPAGQLVLREDDGAFVVPYGGRSGSPGIPSRKIVVSRDAAGTTYRIVDPRQFILTLTLDL